MKTKNIGIIIGFICISILLLISLTGCTMLEETQISSAPTTQEVDTSYNTQLASINKLLEKNANYQHVDSVIKNLKFDTYSYTLHIFGKENNDKQILNARAKRLEQIAKGNFDLSKFI